VMRDWGDASCRRTVPGLRAAGQAAAAKATPAARKAFASTEAGAGCVSTSALLEHEIIVDMDEVIPDVLHVELRTCERMLADYLEAAGAGGGGAHAATIMELVASDLKRCGTV
jgi:hypothetical protein